MFIVYGTMQRLFHTRILLHESVASHFFFYNVNWFLVVFSFLSCVFLFRTCCSQMIEFEFSNKFPSAIMCRVHKSREWHRWEKLTFVHNFGCRSSSTFISQAAATYVHQLIGFSPRRFLEWGYMTLRFIRRKKKLDNSSSSSSFDCTIFIFKIKNSFIRWMTMQIYYEWILWIGICFIFSFICHTIFI